MDAKETWSFAQQLMKEVWEPLIPKLYRGFSTETYSFGIDAPTVLGKNSLTMMSSSV